MLQLILLLACYFISRCFFTVINLKHFQDITFSGFLKICFFALRYDISALLVINSLYIALVLFPMPWWRMPRWELLTQCVFIASNTIALLFDISDWAYYPYNLKRSTADVLNMISRKGDFLLMLPRFVIDYWYVPVCSAGFVWLLIKMNNGIRRRVPLSGTPKPGNRAWVMQVIILAITGGLCLLGIRGGTQYIPVGIRNAVQVTEARYAPIVLNTPFSIINSFQNDAIPELKYYPESELPKYYNFHKQYEGKGFRKKNVVVIILESFSKEFTKLGGHISYTPFLDSLMTRSFVHTGLRKCAAFGRRYPRCNSRCAITNGRPHIHICIQY
ncbi:MAG: hypothetical protein H0X33_03935 [Taibaiella sp.]|nr:hypothetical protein [Taibaiella sp.]